jgi:hypothetical protein
MLSVLLIVVPLEPTYKLCRLVFRIASHREDSLPDFVTISGNNVPFYTEEPMIVLIADPAD